MPARDTWARDLAFLDALVDLSDESMTGLARGHEVADHLDLDEQASTPSIRRLIAGDLIEIPAGAPTRVNAGPYLSPLRPTAAGLHRSGAWPTPETGLDRMIAALEAIAADEHEPDAKRSRARTVLGALAGAGRDLGVDVVGAVIANQMT